MQLLYNSESYAVVQFDLPAPSPASTTAPKAPQATAASPDGALVGQPMAELRAGAFEIVDKFARREIFIQGALAERFRAGVESIVAAGPSEDLFDEFIASFTEAAQQPVTLH